MTSREEMEMQETNGCFEDCLGQDNGHFQFKWSEGSVILRGQTAQISILALHLG